MIRRICLIGLLAFAASLATGCDDKLPVGPDREYSISAEGTIRKQGSTTYQYGTHVLDGPVRYALASSTIDLDDYTGMSVTVKGELFEGYPVDGARIIWM